MNKTRKIFAAILAALMIVSLMAAVACTNPDIDVTVTDAPATDEPEATEAPETTDGPEATEAPATDAPETEASETEEPNIPTDYYYQLMHENETVTVDLDFDGVDEEITLITEPGEYDTYYTLKVVRGTGEVYTDRFEYECYYANAFIVDCDKYDNGMEIVCCYGFESDDNVSIAYRVQRGSDIERFEGEGSVASIDEDAEIYARDGEFYINFRTDILETITLQSLFTIDETGFVCSADRFYYPEYAMAVEVIEPMPARTVGEDDEPADEITVPVGEFVTPLETDCESWVLCSTSNGDRIYIMFEFPEDSWIPYINGVPQHEYLAVLYAD
ncbi:MAG: hypothetical protein J5544_05810 [Clostridia bacterium]|nr:hypothetical protein [Clostridia bacterium]